MKVYLSISASNNSIYCLLVETCLPFHVQKQNLQEANLKKTPTTPKKQKPHRNTPDLVSICAFKYSISIILLKYVT